MLYLQVASIFENDEIWLMCKYMDLMKLHAHKGLAGREM